MVECSRVKWGHVEPSRATVQCSGVEYNEVEPSRGMVESSIESSRAK